MIVSHWEHQGVKVRFTFIDGDREEAFTPFTQSYAICFRHDGKILIGSSPKAKVEWSLPGGTVEEGENGMQTLLREVDEELSLRIEESYLLGAQRVEYLNTAHEPHYQLRYAAIVHELPHTPDPDHEVLWTKKAVTPEEFGQYIRWGPLGEHLLKRAVDWFNSRRK